MTSTPSTTREAAVPGGSLRGATLWGGRFTGSVDPRFQAFQASLAVDRRLVREDLEGSRAWARALERAGVLAPSERQVLERGLAAIDAELARDPSALATSAAEDVHSFVEARLGELVGELAKKLHTGRSRNDQVATDLKLWLRAAVADLREKLHACLAALVELADRHAELPMPGYTHLQRAQPITVGHHLLAYAEMLARDDARLRDLAARADTCPLGSGALAGTAFPVDREALAHELGFARASANSLDAVSDRDHACELAFACALLSVHLSRFAEDWIFFASQEAGFLELADAVTTGSSLMPQKKNPDGLELLRGKSARAIGHLTSLLVLLKGLPLAYDKDLQEDKAALFDCVDQAAASLEVAAIVLANARFDERRCRAAAASGYANATDLADLLVRHGVPFRTAHERAGRAVRAALERGVELGELEDGVRHALLPELAALSRAEFREALDLDHVLARRAGIGGTAPARVREAVDQWKERLERWKQPPSAPA
jgi:argininosuccinate lyase